MLHLLFADCAPVLAYAGALAAFILTVVLTKTLMKYLPTDIGRAYAVNAAAAKGKPRGSGVIFVPVFAVCMLLFVPFSWENLFYCILLVLAMLSGYLDDASRIPWSDYKKGLIDLVISVCIALNYALHNGTEIFIFMPGGSVAAVLPVWLYVILGTILVWAAINVVNCTDGVDGLSSTLTLICLASFIAVFRFSGISSDFVPVMLIMEACIAGYLLFNASPSMILMGDAGSRTIGVFFALTAMKSGAPLLFLPLCLVFIIDGGLGLIKIALLRFLKIKILKNTRTPLHDHFRKNKGWSDTQTVLRFAVFQLVIAFAYIYLLV